MSLTVLLVAWLFADDHHPGALRSFAKNGLSRVLVQTASRAAGSFLAKLGQSRRSTSLFLPASNIFCHTLMDASTRRPAAPYGSNSGSCPIPALKAGASWRSAQDIGRMRAGVV